MPNEYVSKRSEYYRIKIVKMLTTAKHGLSKRELMKLCEEVQQYCDDIYPLPPHSSYVQPPKEE